MRPLFAPPALLDRRRKEGRWRSAARPAGWRWPGSLGLWAWGLLVLSLLAQESPPPGPPASLPELRQRLEAHLAQNRFAAAQWGLKVESLDTGQVLFEHNAGKLFVPASNAKLYTAALALDRLGPDFRIRTSLYAGAAPDRTGTLKGDLILYGRGDPALAARFHDGDLDRALAPLVDALARAGVKRVQGDLIADESYFRGPPYGSGWAWDDLQFYYGAEVSALTINDNALDVRVKPGAHPGQPARIAQQPPASWLAVSNRVETVAPGGQRGLEFYRPLNRNVLLVSGRIPADDAGYVEGISVPQPAGWFGQLYREALGRRGIGVRGPVRVVGARDREANPLPRARLVELGAVESPPLRELLALMLKPSQNLYAQLLLLQVGAAALSQEPGAPARTTEAAGLRQLEAFLREAGLTAGQVLLEEGTGLSRGDLVQPAATVQLLRFMSRHRHAAVFREALPVAGVDGTLKNRMKETPAAGNARAKTGTLSYVASLAGYVTTAAQERLVFAIYLNNYANRDPNRLARAELDTIVVMLAGLTAHSSKAEAAAAP